MKKMFGGKPFQPWRNGVGYPKKEAQAIAKGLRNTGFMARLTKEPNGWVVWYRKK